MPPHSPSKIIDNYNTREFPARSRFLENLLRYREDAFALSGVFILLTFLLAPKTYTERFYFNGALHARQLGMQLREKKPQNTVAFIGIALVCLFGTNDILYHNDIIFLGVIAGAS